MPEIPDVVTLTTISSDWGNDLRDRSVQRYASVAARTAAHPTPTEGDLSYLNDANEVFVYNGSAWVAVGSLWGPVVGSAVSATGGALTTTAVTKVSVVFTKPTGWNTYAIVAWGSVMGQGDGGAGALVGHILIGASGSVSFASGASTVAQSVFCSHSLTAQTVSPVTVAVQVSESAANATWANATVHYIATRLT